MEIYEKYNFIIIGYTKDKKGLIVKSKEGCIFKMDFGIILNIEEIKQKYKEILGKELKEYE